MISEKNINLALKKYVDLDALEPITESKVLFDVLSCFHYTKDKKRYGSNIAIGILHPDTKVHMKSANMMTIKFGKNLTSICLQQLIDICNKANWWFVVNRCNHNLVEVDFWQSI